MSDGMNEGGIENMSYGVQTPREMMEDSEYGIPDSNDSQETEPLSTSIQDQGNEKLTEEQSEALRNQVAFDKQKLDDELKKLDESSLSDEDKRGRGKVLHKEFIGNQAEMLTGEKNPTVNELKIEIQKHNLSFLKEAAEGKGDIDIIQKGLAEKYAQIVNEAIVLGKTNEEIEDLIVELTNGRYVKGSPVFQKLLDSNDFQSFFEQNIDLKDLMDVIFEAAEIQELKNELDKAKNDDAQGESLEQKQQRIADISQKIDSFFTSSRSSKADRAVGELGEKIPMMDLLDLVFLAEIKSGQYRSYSEDLGWGAEPKDELKEREMLSNLVSVTSDKSKFEGFLRVVLQKSDDTKIFDSSTLSSMDTFFENLKRKDENRDYLLEGKQLFVLAFQKILNKTVDIEKIHFSHNVNEFIMIALKKYCTESPSSQNEKDTNQEEVIPETEKSK